MTRAPVLFRVDAAPRQGWEHLSRCLTLAAAIQRRRRPAYFLAQLEPGSLGLTIKRGGNDWLEAGSPAGSADDLEEVLQEVRRLRPAAVVVDSPDVKEEYLNALRGSGALVVSLDSLAHTAFPSRLVVNPLLAPGREAYEFVRGTQLLLGARYALVRPEIRRQRPARAQEPAQPFRALVALGDDDPHNQSGELAKCLLNCPCVERVDVLVRPYHRDLAGLQSLAEACPERLEIVHEPGEAPFRIARCHFAVTAGNAWRSNWPASACRRSSSCSPRATGRLLSGWKRKGPPPASAGTPTSRHRPFVRPSPTCSATHSNGRRWPAAVAS